VYPVFGGRFEPGFDILVENILFNHFESSI
jgi:hypothetical protein